MGILTDLVPRAYAVVAITPVGSADPSGSTNATGLISNLTDNLVGFLFLIGGILAVIYLLWSGLQYITAGGSPDKAKVARQGIINAVIGIVIMMATFAIIRFATGVGGFLSDAGSHKASGTSSSSGSSSSTTGSTSSSSSTSGSTTSSSSGSSGPIGPGSGGPANGN